MLGEAKAIGALVELCSDKREAAMEGIILIDLRTEVGSKKTAPDAVSFVTGTWQVLSYQVYRVSCSATQCP